MSDAELELAMDRKGLERVRPCPFCGSSQAHSEGGLSDGKYHHRVVCNRCTAQGPGGATMGEAWAGWQTRSGQNLEEPGDERR